jgi:hypothetical protein
MQITYSIRVDRSYCESVMARYYRQLPFMLHLPVQFGLLAIVLAGWFSWRYNPIVGGLVGASVFVFGILATKAGILFRLRRMPDFGHDLSVSISDAGVAAKGEHVQSTWQWSAYPRSVRFPDGVLLLRAGVIRWLPDSAISGGTAADATTLIGSKTSLRNVA